METNAWHTWNQVAWTCLLMLLASSCGSLAPSSHALLNGQRASTAFNRHGYAATAPTAFDAFIRPRLAELRGKALRFIPTRQSYEVHTETHHEFAPDKGEFIETSWDLEVVPLGFDFHVSKGIKKEVMVSNHGIIYFDLKNLPPVDFAQHESIMSRGMSLLSHAYAGDIVAIAASLSSAPVKAFTQSTEDQLRIYWDGDLDLLLELNADHSFRIIYFKPQPQSTMIGLLAPLATNAAPPKVLVLETPVASLPQNPHQEPYCLPTTAIDFMGAPALQPDGCGIAISFDGFRYQAHSRLHGLAVDLGTRLDSAALKIMIPSQLVSFGQSVEPAFQSNTEPYFELFYEAIPRVPTPFSRGIEESSSNPRTIRSVSITFDFTDFPLDASLHPQAIEDFWHLPSVDCSDCSKGDSDNPSAILKLHARPMFLHDEHLKERPTDEHRDYKNFAFAVGLMGQATFRQLLQGTLMAVDTPLGNQKVPLTANFAVVSEYLVAPHYTNVAYFESSPQLNQLWQRYDEAIYQSISYSQPLPQGLNLWELRALGATISSANLDAYLVWPSERSQPYTIAEEEIRIDGPLIEAGRWRFQSTHGLEVSLQCRLLTYQVQRRAATNTNQMQKLCDSFRSYLSLASGGWLKPTLTVSISQAQFP